MANIFQRGSNHQPACHSSGIGPPFVWDPDFCSQLKPQRRVVVVAVPGEFEVRSSYGGMDVTHLCGFNMIFQRHGTHGNLLHIKDLTKMGPWLHEIL